MNVRYLLLSLMFASSPGLAVDAAQLMPDLTWEKRVLLIFSPHDRHAAYRQQVEVLDAVDEGLRERDMAVIEAFAGDRVAIDGQPQEAGGSSFYRHFSVDSDEFRVILIGKDGMVKLDRGTAVASADLFSLIDAMPMRRLEMQRGG